ASHGYFDEIRRSLLATSNRWTASCSSSSTAPPSGLSRPNFSHPRLRGGSGWGAGLVPDYNLTCFLTCPTLSDNLVTQRPTQYTSRQGKQQWRSRGHIVRPSNTAIGSSAVTGGGRPGPPPYGWPASEPGVSFSWSSGG